MVRCCETSLSMAGSAPFTPTRNRRWRPPGGYERPGISGTKMRYGLGLRYGDNRSFGVRAEVERYSSFSANPFAEGDADMVSVGARCRF